MQYTVVSPHLFPQTMLIQSPVVVTTLQETAQLMRENNIGTDKLNYLKPPYNKLQEEPTFTISRRISIWVVQRFCESKLTGSRVLFCSVVGRSFMFSYCRIKTVLLLTFTRADGIENRLDYYFSL